MYFKPKNANGSDNSQLISKASDPIYVTGMQSMELGNKCNKKFSLDAAGKAQKQSYQNAFKFKAKRFKVNGIRQLADCITDLSKNPYNFLVRGVSHDDYLENVQRNNQNFPEHEEGTPWVMIDVDDIPLPEGIDPLSEAAIEHGISLLPEPFHNATYFYQHSSSAGICNRDGSLLKSGLNAHIFFWLNKRVPGKQLNGYLKEDAFNRNLAVIKTNKGGVAMPQYFFDVAVIRTPSQPHYIALPDLDSGVRCRLKAEDRQGLVQKELDHVVIPELPDDIEFSSSRRERAFREDYKIVNGAVPRTRQVVSQHGVSTYRSLEMPNNGLQRGRNCTGYKLIKDNSIAILEFDDEESKGSWWVGDKTPCLARRFGDEAEIPLWELSENAWSMVCHELDWCFPVLTYDIDLNDNGFLPAMDDFVTTKASLVVAPTGSGKTYRIAEWIKEQENIVIYTAPTIALSKQMHEDLVDADVSAGFYQDVRKMVDLDGLRCIVTTNKSLPRILKLLKRANPSLEPHIVIDEIHMALDDFMRTTHSHKTIEAMFSSADRLFFLTGTITDIQLSTLSNILWHSLGELTDENFRIYQLEAQKQNPLAVMNGAFFEPALLQLAREYKTIIDNGNEIPRTVLLVGTSKLKKFELLFDSLGLSDYYTAVSRNQSTQEEIFEARRTNKPILLASPVFSLGINFEFDPERLWVSTGLIEMDTNQIVQAVNRGNRGVNSCEVKLFTPQPDDNEFKIPNKLWQRLEVEGHVMRETTIRGLLEQHFHIKRASYKELRDCERDTKAAMNALLESGIQNYDVVSCFEETVPFDEEDNETLKGIRAEARGFYDEEIQKYRTRYKVLTPADALLYLDQLKALRDAMPHEFEDGEKPLEHELKSQELAVIAELCDLETRSHMENVSIPSLRRIFGDDIPYLTAQHYEQDTDRTAIAEKIDAIIPVVMALAKVKSGSIDTYGFAKLVRAKKVIRKGIKALAINERDFHKLSRSFTELAKWMVQYQRSSSRELKGKIDDKCIKITIALFEALGIRWVIAKDGTDYSRPCVPQVYDFDAAAFRLMQAVTIYRKATTEQFIFLNTIDQESNQKRIDQYHKRRAIELFEEPPETPSPVTICACKGCIFSRDLGCALGREVDWQDDLHPSLKDQVCPMARKMRSSSTESEHYMLGNYLENLPMVWSQKANDYGTFRGY